MKKVLLRVALILVALLALGATFVAIKIGPSNIIGMIRYDQRRDGDLKVGDRAPNAMLIALDGKGRQPLLDPEGSKPTLLIFGSFTWPPFRRSVDRLRQLHEMYGDRVRFQTVYIREAHPLDEWQMDSNVKEDVCYRQPQTLTDRVLIANDFVKRFRYPIPLAIDEMSDPVEKVYAGWPERFYIIDAKGTIVYKGEPGPFGYHPEEVEAWMKKNV